MKYQKTIPVTHDVWKNIHQLRLKHDFSTLNETLRFLLAIYNNSTPEVLKKAEEKIKSEK